MSSEIIDLTLPAQKPSIPEPRGLLRVPKETEETVARDQARIARQYGVVMAPKARRRSYPLGDPNATAACNPNLLALTGLFNQIRLVFDGTPSPVAQGELHVVEKK
jgi:hypothetical protein